MEKNDRALPGKSSSRESGCTAGMELTRLKIPVWQFSAMIF